MILKNNRQHICYRGTIFDEDRNFIDSTEASSYFSTRNFDMLRSDSHFYIQVVFEIHETKLRYRA